MSGGKWNHMMDQTHIGYTYWQQPEKNAMPEIEEIQLPDSAEMGLAIEGSASWWPKESNEALLPEFSSYQKQNHYIELFNRGTKPFEFSAASTVPWVKIFSQNRKIEKQQRLIVVVDWAKAPPGTHKIPIRVTGPSGRPVTVFAVIKNYGSSNKDSFNGFVESDGHVSMEATHYARWVNSPSVSWQKIPDIGRTGSGMTIIPVTAKRQEPGPAGARLEYDILVFDTGRINVQMFFSPTLNFNGGELQYGLSFDDESPRILNLHVNHSNKSWEDWVANNTIINNSEFRFRKPGKHVLKFWMVDPGIVLQKIVVGLPDVERVTWVPRKP